MKTPAAVPRRPGRTWRRSEYEVRVGAAHAEAGDAHPAAGPFGGQVQRCRHPFHTAPGQPQLRILRAVHGPGRDGAVVQCQYGLDQPGDTGRTLGVADGGLCGAERERGGAGSATGTERVVEGQHLDEVAQRGAGAVRLDVAHLPGCGAGPVERRGDDLALCRAVRGHDAVAAAVLAHRAAVHDGVHEVAVAHRVRQAAQDDDTDALAAADAAGPGGERPAPPVRGGQPGELVDPVQRGAQDEVDPAGQRQVALAGQQRRARQVHGDQGRGAGGVHGQAGPAQIELVGEPVGQHGASATGAGARRDAFRVGQRQPRPVVRHGAHVAAGAAAGQLGRRPPAVLDGPPRALEQQPLLGVHGGGLGGGDAEEAGVEGVRVGEEGARVAGAEPGGRRVTGRVRRTVQQPPVGRRVGRPGERAVEPDDGDGARARAVGARGLLLWHGHTSAGPWAAAPGPRRAYSSARWRASASTLGWSQATVGSR